MFRISTLALLIGLGLVGAGVVTCVTAAPDDPRAFPAIEDLLIIGGITVIALGSARDRRRGLTLAQPPPIPNPPVIQ